MRKNKTATVELAFRQKLIALTNRQFWDKALKRKTKLKKLDLYSFKTEILNYDFEI